MITPDFDVFKKFPATPVRSVCASARDIGKSDADLTAAGTTFGYASVTMFFFSCYLLIMVVID